jgi:hypothetical protein
MAQPKSRVPLAIGLTAAAGVGYYLYQSGGNARVAEKKFEGRQTRGASTPASPTLYNDGYMITH